MLFCSPVTVYDVALVPPGALSGMSVNGLEVPAWLWMYWYFRMGLPPLSVGAVHDSATSRLPPVTVRLCGTPGTVRASGLNESLTAIRLWPTLFTA